jgi:hypothetical protein
MGFFAVGSTSTEPPNLSTLDDGDHSSRIDASGDGPGSEVQ